MSSSTGTTAALTQVPAVALPRITIQFCTQCKWLLRGAFVSVKCVFYLLVKRKISLVIRFLISNFPESVWSGIRTTWSPFKLASPGLWLIQPGYSMLKSSSLLSPQISARLLLYQLPVAYSLLSYITVYLQQRARRTSARLSYGSELRLFSKKQSPLCATCGRLKDISLALFGREMLLIVGKTSSADPGTLLHSRKMEGGFPGTPIHRFAGLEAL